MLVVFPELVYFHLSKEQEVQWALMQFILPFLPPLFSSSPLLPFSSFLLPPLSSFSLHLQEGVVVEVAELVAPLVSSPQAVSIHLPFLLELSLPRSLRT